MPDRPEPADPEAARPRRRVLPEEVLAVACMALLVLLTLANVVVRYLTDRSFATTEEVSIALMVVMTVAGAAAAAARDRHIRIEYFYETGSTRRRRRFALLSAIATCAFFALFALLSARVVWDEYRYQETSMALGVPRWWYTVWVPVLCAVIAARAAAVAGRVRRGLMLPGTPEPPVGAPPDADRTGR